MRIVIVDFMFGIEENVVEKLKCFPFHLYLIV